MIEKISLENYRCYKKHEIEFNELSIVVGKNNAGKSTLIEALRLISLVTNRYKMLTYKKQPHWTTFPHNYYGVSPSLKGINISFKNLFYKNGLAPARIVVYFTDKSKVDLLINKDGDLFAVLFDEEGKIIKNKRQATKFNLPIINILPQIGPLREKEKFLDTEYIKSNIYSNLSSLHFRNQLSIFGDFLPKFFSLAQETWEGLKIKNFERGDRIYDVYPELIVEEDDFAVEVGLVGHGLQIWLQIMWFIARCKSESTVILDEPDVYLHADMQIKLIKFLKNKFKQTIIATHSIEIISEVEPKNLIIVNKSEKKSKIITNLEEVQKIIENIGSIQNIELIRYWASGKLLIVEGDRDDIKILNIFQNKLFPDSNRPFNLIPKYCSGGWDGWQRVLGASIIKEGNKKIKIYCIFDSDYHTDEEKKSRIIQAKKHNINLHIWSKKEIENYLINPRVLFRYINAHHKNGKPTQEMIIEKIEELANKEKDYIADNFAREISKSNKSLAIPRCNSEARTIIGKYWNNLENKISISPGKRIMRKISDWSKKEFNFSFSKFDIANAFGPNEINQELKEIIVSMENKKNF